MFPGLRPSGVVALGEMPRLSDKGEWTAEAPLRRA